MPGSGGVALDQRLLGRIPGDALDRRELEPGVDLGVELQHRGAELQRDAGLAAGLRRLDDHLLVVGEDELAVRLGAGEQKVPVRAPVLHLLRMRDRASSSTSRVESGVGQQRAR